MIGIPNNLPKYLKVCFYSNTNEQIFGTVIDAFEEDVLSTVRENYSEKYKEAMDASKYNELPVVVKTEGGSQEIVMLKDITTMSVPVVEEKVDVNKELHKIYALLDSETKTKDGESVSELLRDVLYKINH